QHPRGHAIVAVTAELRAIDLVTPFLHGPEPDRDAQPRDGILTDAQGNDFERVDYVLRRDVDDHRPGLTIRVLRERHMQLVQTDNVILAFRITRIDAEHIFGRDEPHFLLTELAVFAGIPDVPGKRLRDHFT